jgi:hypothetical protein
MGQEVNDKVYQSLLVSVIICNDACLNFSEPDHLLPVLAFCSLLTVSFLILRTVVIDKMAQKVFTCSGPISFRIRNLSVKTPLVVC